MVYLQRARTYEQGVYTDLFRVIGIATYLLLWPEDGVMRKEDIRGIYDGSIFYKKARQYEERRAKTRKLK